MVDGHFALAASELVPVGAVCRSVTANGSWNRLNIANHMVPTAILTGDTAAARVRKVNSRRALTAAFQGATATPQG